MPYKCELRIGDSGNIADFVINDKISVELKTVSYLIKEHYNQVKRYLHQTGHKQGILLNFQDEQIRSKRILNINNLRNLQNL